MRPIILSFSGAIGSGKSTLSAGVSFSLGWNRASFGDYLRSEAEKRGIKPSREALQDLGESFILMGWDTFVRNVLSHGGWKPEECLVVDGIRHVTALETIQRLTFPSHTFLINIETRRRIRLKRLMGQGVNASRLRKYESHSTERQVSILLPGLADLTIDGSLDKARNIATIVEWVGKFRA